MPPERMPKSPFRREKPVPEDFEERGETVPEATSVPEEVRAWSSIFIEFPRRLRAKVPENPKDVDKPRENISESVGDRLAMTAYLLHYFLPLLERKGVQIDYARTFDMTLASGISGIADTPPVADVRKTLKQQKEEIISVAKSFKDLPRRNGFGRELFDAHAEYLEQKTVEAQFVRALKGLEFMLYMLSRPPKLREDLVEREGYTLEDYQKRIGAFCNKEGFEPLGEFYRLIERFLQRKECFAPPREDEDDENILSPEEAHYTFVSHKPVFRDSPEIDIRDENRRLSKLQRLKRKLCFGQPSKPESDHHDTVPEHVALLLIKHRYSLSFTREDILRDKTLSPYLRKAILKEFTLRNGSEMVLGHDMPEIIKGDTIAPVKTETDAVEEWDIATEIAGEYAPRAGGYDERFWKNVDQYETDRDRQPFLGIAWYTKLLDILEPQEFLFDPETREKLSHMRVLTRDEVRKRAEIILPLFPSLKEYFDDLEKQFIEEGLP